MKIPLLSLLNASALAANHGHTHGHGHHRKARTPQPAARDSGNPPFAVDIINNTPNDNVHVYVIPDHDKSLFLSLVDSS